MAGRAARTSTPLSVRAAGPVRDGGGRDCSEQDDVFLWRALAGPRRSTAPLVYLPGLGPHSTNRTRLQRAVQRSELVGVGLHRAVWVVGRRSPLKEGTTIAGLAEEHARAIRSRFPAPVDVIGESTGGSIALQLALDHPDVVKRLIVISAASRMPGAGRAAQREVVRSLRAGRPRRAAGTMLAATTRRPIRRRLLRAAGFTLGRVVIGRSDHDLMVLIEAEDEFDLRPDLLRVSAPTVVLGGAQDGYYSPELFRATADEIPNASYVEYPKKGHLTAATDHAVSRAIRDRLRREPEA
ncbi:MAG: alpha/beta hydrolase [Acidobacteria bacterium]|nr:alpha/beta hydrolase [Acidobacteriota bacterium]